MAPPPSRRWPPSVRRVEPAVRLSIGTRRHLSDAGKKVRISTGVHKSGLEPVTVKETDHYRIMREFCDDPAAFVQAAIAE